MSYTVTAGSLANSGFFQVFKSIANKSYTIAYDFQLLVGSSCQVVIQDEYGVKLVNPTTISNNSRQTGTITVTGNGNNIAAGVLIVSAGTAQKLSVNSFVVTRVNSTTPTLYDLRLVNGATTESSGSTTIIQNIQNQVLLDESLTNTFPAAVSTQSFLGADNNQPLNIKKPTDDYHSYHFYDASGPTTENLQYLQLTQNVQYPTSTSSVFNSTYYQDASSSYMLGLSIQVINYNSDYWYSDSNKLTKREMFNLLQDMGQINTSTQFLNGQVVQSGGSTGFANFWEVFNKGFADLNDKVPSLFGGILNVDERFINYRANGSIDLWNWGNHAIIWRLDLSSNQVISRPLINMSKALDPSGAYLLRAASRGPITSFGDGRFALTIQNFSQNGIIIFDKNLTPITLTSQSSYNTFSRETSVPATNYVQRSQLAANVQQDQYNNIFIKSFSPLDLSGISYTSVIDGTPVNPLNTPNGNATFLYVSSSSQSQYDSQETTGGYLVAGALTLLGDYRWNQSRGKVIQYAYFRDGSNNWKLEPVNVFYTCPDLYKAGDKVQIESFIKDPTTQQYQPLKFIYPLFDNRSSTLIGVGTYRDASAFQDTFNGTVYSQTTFTDGSNGTLPITAGLQKLAINIYDVSGGTPGLGSIVSGPIDTVNGPKLKGKKFYQDVYGTHYIKLNDGVDDYWRQSSLGVLNQLPTDASVNFYLTTTTRKYVDLTTNITYTDNGSGVFLNSGVADPSPQADVRKTIMNNCLCTRYMFSPYNFNPALLTSTYIKTDASGRSLLADGTSVVAGCPFNDQFDAGLTFGPNPCVPPFATGSTHPSSILSQNGGRFIKPEFYFNNGHQFDSTTTYYSRPYSLRWRDIRNYTTGGYRTVAASGVNTNYGQFIDLSGVLVKEYVRLCQSAQGTDPTQHDVQVLLEGETYTDLSGVTTVPSGSIAFKVKGKVFNGQPLIATINATSAGNLTLSKIAADRLNIVGSGVYGMLSYHIDENGNHHLLGGAGNTNAAPISDMFYPPQWAAKFIGNQIQTILNGGKTELSSTISTSTLTKLGFDNVNWDIQPQPNYNYFEDSISYNTAIIDNSGQILLDLTLRGLNAFAANISRYGQGLYRTTYIKGNNMIGDPITYNSDIALSNEYRCPIADPQGNTAPWTGAEYLECWNFYIKCIEIRSRCSNPRIDRVVSCRPFIIEPKTLKLEHIVKSSNDLFEIYSTFSRSYIKMVDDVTFYDSGDNRDQVGGQVTCGDVYFAGTSKKSSRIYLKKDVSSPTLQDIGGLKSYPSDASRPNFALTKFTKLGSQPNLSSLDGPQTYGSSETHWMPVNGLQAIQGSNHYLGKINSKDAFLFVDCALHNQDGIAPYTFIPILPNTKYNNFENVDSVNKTIDGTAYILPMAWSTGYNTIAPGLNRPKNWRIMIAYTKDDNDKVVPIWYSVIPLYYYPDLAARDYSAPNGSQAAASGYDGKNCTIINDVVFTSQCRSMYALDAKTGEFLAEWYGDDFEALEKNFRDLGFGNSSRIDIPHIGCISSTTGMVNFGMGFRRAGTISSWGRHLLTMQVKKNDKVTAFPLSNIFLGSGSLDVVFKPEDCATYNNNKFILVSTFKTQDRFGKIYPNYPFADSSFNMLYYSGITAFAIDATSDYALSLFNNKQDVIDKIVNGGSWFLEKKVSFSSIRSSILFLYAGHIPAKAAKRSPFVFNDRQVLECKSIRNQKMILSEINRVKNGNTYPYPDNGYYLEGSSRMRASYPSVTTAAGYTTAAGVGNVGYNPLNTMRYNYYKDSSDNQIDSKTWKGSLASASLYNPSFNKFNWNASLPASSQIYNQPLGYTDVGTGRPFAGQSGYDAYGTPL